MTGVQAERLKLHDNNNKKYASKCIETENEKKCVWKKYLKIRKGMEDTFNLRYSMIRMLSNEKFLFKKQELKEKFLFEIKIK